MIISKYNILLVSVIKDQITVNTKVGNGRTDPGIEPAITTRGSHLGVWKMGQKALKGRSSVFH